MPLGPDPDSGLWEFGHVHSGELAKRDPRTGKLRFDLDSGLVFVLFTLGAASFMIVRQPREAAMGLLTIVAGLPVYWWMRRGRRSTA